MRHGWVALSIALAVACRRDPPSREFVIAPLVRDHRGLDAMAGFVVATCPAAPRLIASRHAVHVDATELAWDVPWPKRRALLPSELQPGWPLAVQNAAKLLDGRFVAEERDARGAVRSLHLVLDAVIAQRDAFKPHGLAKQNDPIVGAIVSVDPDVPAATFTELFSAARNRLGDVALEVRGGCVISPFSAVADGPSAATYTPFEDGYALSSPGLTCDEGSDGHVPHGAKRLDAAGVLATSVELGRRIQLCVRAAEPTGRALGLFGALRQVAKVENGPSLGVTLAVARAR